ncbi:nucleoside hydrolase [Oleiharenicola lentus]|nr:nucleoside hydrolase [Oleiharenicola lentus]
MKLLLLECLLFGSLVAAPIPVLLDTDIGTDIDDAYALAQVLRSPELELLGVTTVSGDAVARARLAAKLLTVAGRSDVPVYAGLSTATQYMKQVEWAAGFTSPALHSSGGIEFLRQQINARPGEIVLIAVGELTNVAALLESEPGIGKKLKAIALMGGSIRRGYAPGSKPEPEWNIKSAAKAAQVVFSSGVPLLIAPLDSTSDLKLTTERKTRLFAHGTPLTDALAALDFVWTHTNTWSAKLPTLFDNLAVTLVATPDHVLLTALHLVVEADGTTREVADRPPNARVALTSDPAAFLDHFVARLVSPVR